MTDDQAKYVYKKVNAGKEINTETMKQEMEQEKSIKTELDDSCYNTCQKTILCVAHRKIQDFQVVSRECGVFYELGQYDLLYTYGAIA